MTKHNLQIVKPNQPLPARVLARQAIEQHEAKNKKQGETLGILKGETNGIMTYPLGFYSKFLAAAVIKPNYKLSEVLYPKENYDKNY